MTRRIMLIATVAAAWLSAGCGAIGDRPEGYEKRDYVVDPSLRFRPVPLTDIVRNPQEGAPVEFSAMLNRRDENVWQPYYTPFRPGDYKSFSVWPDDAAVWDPRGRGRSIPTLYLSVDSPEIADLYTVERYSPVRIRGVVRSSFDSRPWIQVHYVDQVGSPWFSDESLGHLIRGLDEGQTNGVKGVALLEAALDGPLSPAAEAAAWKGLGWIHLSRKQYSDAEDCYGRALDAMPGDRQAADGLSRARRKAAPGPWVEEKVTSDTPEAAPDWKGMYAVLLAEHEAKCKTLADDHARCPEMVHTMTVERDAAIKAHAECGAGTEGLKKSLEEKDAALKSATDKAAAMEAERDDLKKKMEGGGADLEGAKKAVEEKEAQIKDLNGKLAALQTERDELKKRAEAGGDPEALKKQIDEKEAQIKAATEKSAELTQQVKDRDETIKKQREEIDRLTEELKKKEGGN